MDNHARPQESLSRPTKRRKTTSRVSSERNDEPLVLPVESDSEESVSVEGDPDTQTLSAPLHPREVSFFEAYRQYACQWPVADRLQALEDIANGPFSRFLSGHPTIVSTRLVRLMPSLIA